MRPEDAVAVAHLMIERYGARAMKVATDSRNKAKTEETAAFYRWVVIELDALGQNEE